ncbi:MAG TPA: sigma factor-like helix-turn-helix DNA-binding protein [Streptosporangiaceae bacterium]|jgi:hypothetical protein
MHKAQTLEDALRRELGTFRDLELPSPDAAKAWQRVRNCLFCGGKHCAKINYKIGWYKCFHVDCLHDVSIGPDDITSRFRAQIDCAVIKLCKKWMSIDPADARSYACERVLIYAGEPMPDDSDAGQLPEWETVVKGDPNQLDRYVLRALNCDLLNWAAKRARNARNIEEIAVKPVRDDGDDEWVPTIADVYPRGSSVYPATEGTLREYPLLRMIYGDGYTIAEIAEQLGKSARTVKRMEAAEKRRYLDGAVPPCPAKKRKARQQPTHYIRQRNGVVCPAGCGICEHIARSEDKYAKRYMPARPLRTATAETPSADLRLAA